MSENRSDMSEEAKRLASFNKYQEAHMNGTFDVYSPIQQENGLPPLPPLAVQWREDAQRRFGKNENPSSRRSALPGRQR